MNEVRQAPTTALSGVVMGKAAGAAARRRWRDDAAAAAAAKFDGGALVGAGARSRKG